MLTNKKEMVEDLSDEALACVWDFDLLKYDVTYYRKDSGVSHPDAVLLIAEISPEGKKVKVIEVNLTKKRYMCYDIGYSHTARNISVFEHRVLHKMFEALGWFNL